MRKITFLMLVLLSSLTLYKGQSTFLTNNQIDQIYKIVKQNDYLKQRLGQTEKTLLSSEKIVGEQKTSIVKYKELITTYEGRLNTLNDQNVLALQSKDIEIDRLKELSDVQVKIGKKQARKSFRKGLVIGGVSVAVVGTVTLLYLAGK